MSAGIISACLPTLGPVLAIVIGKMGIKRTLLSGAGAATANTLSSQNFAKSATASLSDRTDVELQKSRKDTTGAGAFYRLPDDQLPAERARGDVQLRPEHGYGYTVSSQPGKGDGESLSGDEVPLHGIMVHTDFKRSTS